MEKETFGLLGKNIDYSFSRTYFAEKFKRENIPAQYLNFDLENIEDFPNIIQNTSNLIGLNVTIPYKEVVIPYLDALDADAKKIAAVNAIKIGENGKLTGYNTDFIGFSESLKPFLKPHDKKALILGTGGASKAVAFAFSQLGIDFLFVSRQPGPQNLNYSEINKELLEQYTILVNCTPLGTFPQIEKHPNIPFEFLNNSHLVYDLIYNPGVTTFMEKAKQKGATVTNGLKMLELQAEAAWKIWNS